MPLTPVEWAHAVAVGDMVAAMVCTLGPGEIARRANIVSKLEAAMPSRTPKQRRTMAAAAHDAAFARKVGIPQSVAREFNQADKKKRRGKRK
jgi:hypothetical protein